MLNINTFFSNIFNFCNILIVYYFKQSFYRYNAFKNPVGASDIVHAASALVEMYGAAVYSSSYDNNNNSNGYQDVYRQQQQQQQELDQQQQVVQIESANNNDDQGNRINNSNNTNTNNNGTSSNDKIASIEAFYEAYHCLSMRSESVLQRGVQCALDLQRVGNTTTLVSFNWY